MLRKLLIAVIYVSYFLGMLIISSISSGTMTVPVPAGKLLWVRAFDLTDNGSGPGFMVSHHGLVFGPGDLSGYFNGMGY